MLMSLLLMFSWFAPGPVNEPVLQPVSSPAPESAPASVEVSCALDSRMLAPVAESDVRIQPWLLTQSAESKTMETAWQNFYDELPPELRVVILPAKILRITDRELVAGEALADQLNASVLQAKLASLSNDTTIPLIYTDFPFTNVYRKQAGLYLRQTYDFLTTTDAEASYSAVTEEQWLTWLAFINK